MFYNCSKFAAANAARVPFFKADTSDFRIVRNELSQFRANNISESILEAIESLKKDVALLKNAPSVKTNMHDKKEKVI